MQTIEFKNVTNKIQVVREIMNTYGSNNLVDVITFLKGIHGEVCPKCQGVGYSKTDTPLFGASGEYSKQPCLKCKGVGYSKYE